MKFNINVAQLVVCATTTVGVFGNLCLNYNKYKEIKCPKDQK